MLVTKPCPTVKIGLPRIFIFEFSGRMSSAFGYYTTPTTSAFHSIQQQDVIDRPDSHQKAEHGFQYEYQRLNCSPSPLGVYDLQDRDRRLKLAPDIRAP